MNLENDVAAGVQMILLVEDSIRFYSSILPNLYRFVLQQSLEFSTEALNAQLETLRMRGRPKSCWPVRMKRPGTCTPVIRRTRWGSSATAVSP